MDIDEDTKSSSVLQEKLTTIIKRVVYISIASTILVILLLTTRFCISTYVVEERSFSLADIPYFINFGTIGISFLSYIAILTILPLLSALWFVRYIKKDVIYGRYIGDALKKFLQCHLTMYVVVGTVMIIGCVVFQDTPLGRNHVARVTTKFKQALRALNRTIRKFAPKRIFESLYKATLEPILTYALEAWYPYQVHLHRE
uniref:Uncharacterized protein n=1 Tax=Acrobeloides nanus TaxID=290746 RepID=A0A914CR32_9BILA